MADKVRPGQEIKASQLNNVIDAMSIGQPNAVQPFRNTATGGLVNGGHAYVTKAPSKFDGLFNISYGSGIWPDYFASEGQNFTGIWVQLADWEQSAFALEATDANPPYISIFLIDGYAQNPTLVWLASEGQYSKSGKFPLCPADEDAGIAVLQLFTDASHTSSALNGMVAIVIGDHSIFGATKGCFPEATPQTLANYLQAIKNSNPQYFADLQDIRAIDRNVLYVGKSELGDDDNQYLDVAPTTYTLGQLRPRTTSDSWTIFSGKDLYLSSLGPTDARQFGQTPDQASFSQSLYRFDQISSDYYSLEAVKSAADLSGGYGPGSGLSSFDILARHKAPHPEAGGGNLRYHDQAQARLEYIDLEGFVNDIAGDVDSNISALHLSSIQDGIYTDPDTGKDTKYHELFKFDQSELTDFQISDDCDIVLRDYTRSRVPVGAAVNYVKLSTFLSGLSSTDVDTWATQGAQRSIDWKTQSNKKYLQLYNFDNNGYEDALRVNLAYGQHRYATKEGSGEYPDPYVEFVVRDRSGARMVKYDALDIYAPPISASDVTDLCTVISSIAQHECSCDLGPLSAKVDQLSSSLSNYWKVDGTYDDNCHGHSIGDSGANLAIDLDNGGLWYESSQTVDWHTCELYDQNGADAKGNICLNWADRKGYDSGGNVTLDWENGKLSQPSTGNDSVDWKNGVLYKPTTGTESLNWKIGYAKDPSGSGATVNWNTGQLWANDNTRVMNWKLKQLIGGWSTQNGGLTIASGNTLTIGNTSITENQLQQLLALLNTP